MVEAWHPWTAQSTGNNPTQVKAGYVTHYGGKDAKEFYFLTVNGAGHSLLRLTCLLRHADVAWCSGAAVPAAGSPRDDQHVRVRGHLQLEQLLMIALPLQPKTTVTPLFIPLLL